MSGVHPVIMAGGRGTRFWPASREACPKQFLAVAGDESLLRMTGKRLYPVAGEGHVWVVTNRAHVDLAAQHLPEVSREKIIGEPEGRNTAPCIALAAALVAREDPEGVLLVAPADHWIGDEEAFRRAARIATDFARERRALVTFGVVPTSPETGYGYIEAGPSSGETVLEVSRFTEKPDRATAAGFLAGGRHYWNSGIFAWRADAFLEELGAQHPEMVSRSKEIAEAPDLEAALDALYPGMTSISVDYAVLEPSSNVYMVPASFPWSDVGSWDALAQALSADEAGNALEGDALAIESSGCLVRASTRFTAVVGVRDLLVIDMPDALLICPKERAQDVKKVVETLERQQRRHLL